jgi:hypothetical protein
METCVQGVGGRDNRETWSVAQFQSEIIQILLRAKMTSVALIMKQFELIIKTQERKLSDLLELFAL